METNKENRIIYLDYIRSLAICLVILSHIASSGVNMFDVHTYEWHFSNAIQSIVYICVPLLVMTSGVLFMEKERKIRRHIINIGIHLIIWSFLYAVYDNFSSAEEMSFKNIMRYTLQGHYHLWFLNMIMGLYLICPCLFIWKDRKEIIRYFLALWLVFLGFGYLSNVFVFYPLIDKMQMKFVMGYTGFFLLGHYLNKFVSVEFINSKLLYISLAVTYLITNLGTVILSGGGGSLNAVLYGYFTPNIIICSICVFLLIKKTVKADKCLKIIQIFSQDSFGIYLIHDFFIIFLAHKNLTIYQYSPYIQIPLAFIFVVLVSWSMVRILRKIPILNKILI